MKITPLDIRHKEFTRSMRGYRDADVDEFLDEITEEFERLFNENIDYREQLETLEEKISGYKNIEETLQKTLISAQQQAEEMKQNAQKEADLIMRDADLKARSNINDSYAERQKVQRSVQALKQKYDNLKYQLRKIVDAYGKILDQDMDSMDEMDLLEASEAAEESAAAASTPAADAEVLSVAGGATPTVDEAVSIELKEQADSGQRPAGDAVPVQAETATRKVSVSIPPRNEDPFADVEIDTDENKFKW
ncbi:MAG: DivIVA domain-containing protein [Thermoleophilia bacterium]